MKSETRFVAVRLSSRLNNLHSFHPRTRQGLSTMPMRSIISACLLLFLSAVASKPLHAAEGKPPNILFLFADDLTCQAISTYGEQRKLLETPNMDRIARRDAVRSLPGDQLHLRAEPGDHPDRQVLAPQRLLQQLQQSLRRQPADVSQAAARCRLLHRHDRQMASGQRPNWLRLLAHPAGARSLLQPADDSQRREA